MMTTLYSFVSCIASVSLAALAMYPLDALAQSQEADDEQLHPQGPSPETAA